MCVRCALHKAVPVSAAMAVRAEELGLGAGNTAQYSTVQYSAVVQYSTAQHCVHALQCAHWVGMREQHSAIRYHHHQHPY